MDEKDILEFREKAVSYFIPVLLEEGYNEPRAADLAFYTAKILEDALLLIKNIEENNSDFEKIINNIHLLYTNSQAFEEAKKILMWKDINYES
jgi:hypothetical protein